MKNGLNTDVIYQGMTFHVQTEDFGKRNGYFQTQVYYRGKILATERHDYSDLIDDPELSEALEARIQSEHQQTIEDVKRGRVDMKDLDPVLTSLDRSDKKSDKIKIVAQAGKFGKKRTRPKSPFENSEEMNFEFKRAQEGTKVGPLRRAYVPLLLALTPILLISLIALPKLGSTRHKEKRFDELIRQGEEMTQRHEFEQAEPLFNRAVDLFPNRSSTYLKRAMLFSKMETLTRAIEDIQQAAELDPSNGAILFELGRLYMETTDYSGAGTALEKAIQYDYRTQNVYLLLGTALFRMGDIEKAQEKWTEALKIGPKNPKIYYHLGLAALKKESYGEAIEDFLTAITLDSELAEAYTPLGDAYYLSGQQNKAARYWAKALKLNPKDSVAKAKLGSLR